MSWIWRKLIDFSETKFESPMERLPTKYAQKGGGVRNTNTNQYRGLKCYGGDHKMSWMDSSIDLSQPEIVNIGSKPKPAELSTASNFHENSFMRKSAGFVPMKHPYEWNAVKPLNPIPGRSLQRVSEDVNTKVNFIRYEMLLA